MHLCVVESRVQACFQQVYRRAYGYRHATLVQLTYNCSEAIIHKGDPPLL